MSETEIERGAASIEIELRDGAIEVRHGSDGGTVLARLDNAPAGTWDALWNALESLGIHNMYRS